ncbi:GTPase HflX [Solidesulfovibrio sp.]|uniref:GTPase HflX n=1 Tax=Solidesulfovibrio sp. TaxID=2910990 RepID=UPI002B1F6942|nr:GTPase HflX [Solidesulfovibrio sp.]MEA5090266.1 GTPase HflX [Solidesulfovibrio sp.]
MERLGTRRYPSKGAATPEQARELAAIAYGIGRQVGLLIDRKGRPTLILVGTPKGILIPELDRSRLGAARLRGVRLLHTHLAGEPLSEEDLTDMLFLRLDSVAALTVDDQAQPVTLHAAVLLPPGAGDAPYDVLPPRPFDKVEEDFNALAAALEEELAREGERLAAPQASEAGREKAVLVSVSNAPRAVQEASLAELAALADTAGLAVAESVVQRVATVNPKYILGKGKLAEIEVAALRAGASLLVFDGELSPSQIRNLAEVTQLRVIDRTQLILDIFAQHAASRGGKLQVEMAQLKYLQPRLVRQDRAMSRLMGGIGGRGPGETKLEVDRRRIRDRIGRIKDELKELRKRRAAARAGRARAGLPVVSLVGYTNAGKSTLLNTLTGSAVLAENRLFATLDPTSRRLRFPSDKEIILTDTVGFIRELPKELKEAFRATLEELEAADLLVAVADASHPEVEAQAAAVAEILREMGLGDIPRLFVLNKWDAVPEDGREPLRNAFPEAITLSAKNREGLSALTDAILQRVRSGPGVRDHGPALERGADADGNADAETDGAGDAADGDPATAAATRTGP